MEDKRQEYIKYFTYMQEEDKKVPLGGKPWDGHTSKDVRRLLSIPAADVAPVVHGRWIASHDEFCTCSICKYPFYVGWNQANYCPNCGAKME